MLPVVIPFELKLAIAGDPEKSHVFLISKVIFELLPPAFGLIPNENPLIPFQSQLEYGSDVFELTLF